MDSGANVDLREPSVTSAAVPPTRSTDLPASFEAAAHARRAIADVVGHAPHLPGDVASALTGAGDGGSAAWMATALLLTLATLGAALLVRFVVTRRVGAVRLPAAGAGSPPSADPRARRFARAMGRILADWTATAAGAAAGVALLLVIAPDPGPARWTAFVALASLALFLVLQGLVVPLLSGTRGEGGLVPVGPEEARAFLRQLVAVFAVGSVLLGLAGWLGGLGIDPASHALLRIVTLVVVVAAFVAVFAIHRKSIGAAIRGKAEAPSLLRQVLASGWHVLVSLYLVAASALQIVGIATGGGAAAGPILAPILGFVAGFFAYGAVLVVLDRRLRAQRARLDSAGSRRAASATAPAAAGGNGAGDAPDGAIIAAARPPEDPVIIWQRRWNAFASDVALVGAAIVGAGVVAALWGLIDVADGAPGWLAMALVLFAAYVAYKGVRTWIDGAMEDEEGPAAAGDPDEGMGPGASRLATLLPLARNFLSFAIVAVAAMIVLAGLGVNVAPLFAGAGVVGLAVGFGAQTLIRDIFSGAFFLADDAFRRGEYIDVGGITGAVEKISLRSFQLRHHNGPLHTIPFGEIKQLTNFSRDWVIMKLKLRIVYGTDMERVRKLVKKLGQEMMKDPEIGPLFLQPLKSQGVVEMEDSAMIMRVKFMTRPGDQFTLRRHVYTRIGELFEREGIRFAHRQVTVRIAEEEAADDAARRAAVGAAARAAVDGAAPASP